MLVNASVASTRSLHRVYSTCAKQFGEKDIFLLLINYFRSTKVAGPLSSQNFHFGLDKLDTGAGHDSFPCSGTSSSSTTF